LWWQAEEYCPVDTHALGGVLQRQAHVTGLASVLAECSAPRDNGACLLVENILIF
jgi:hypothetical protein